MADARTPVEQFNDMIRGLKFVILTTVCKDGSPQSCPMATREADEQGYLWFFTRTNTHTVQALRDNQHIGLAYFDAANQRYISVCGIADLRNDPAKIRQLWDARYEPWLPQGVDDPALALIRVLITAAEYWDGSEARMVSLPGFADPAVTGAHYRRVGHREIELPENQRLRNP